MTTSIYRSRTQQCLYSADSRASNAHQSSIKCPHSPPVYRTFSIALIYTHTHAESIFFHTMHFVRMMQQRQYPAYGGLFILFAIAAPMFGCTATQLARASDESRGFKSTGSSIGCPATVRRCSDNRRRGHGTRASNSGIVAVGLAI